MQIDRRPNRGPYVAALICLLTLCLTIPLYWQSAAERAADRELGRDQSDGLTSATGGNFVRFDRYPAAKLPEYGPANLSPNRNRRRTVAGYSQRARRRHEQRAGPVYRTDRHTVSRDIGRPIAVDRRRWAIRYVGLVPRCSERGRVFAGRSNCLARNATGRQRKRADGALRISSNALDFIDQSERPLRAGSQLRVQSPACRRRRDAVALVFADRLDRTARIVVAVSVFSRLGTDDTGRSPGPDRKRTAEHAARLRPNSVICSRSPPRPCNWPTRRMMTWCGRSCCAPIGALPADCSAGR